MKKCLQCAEEIQEAAIKCKHCGSNLQEPLPQPPQQTSTPVQEKKKKSGCLMWVILIILIIIGGQIIIEATSPKKNNPENIAPIAITQDKSTPGGEEDDKNLVTYKELESYRKGGKLWKNIVIPSGTSQDDLKALAKSLHRKDPTSNYHIFDDDAKFQELKNSDVYYGKLKDKDGQIKDITECIDVEYCRALVQKGQYAYPFPEAWANKHHIANIQQMFTTKMEWQLVDRLGDTIIKL